MKKIYLFKQSLVLSTALLFFIHFTQAQTNIFPSTGSAGIGTTTPNAKSILEMVSTTKGMLVPRMTKNQRDAILPPTTAAGLLIYQTNSAPGFYYYDGTAWKAVTPKAKGWSLTGNAGTDPATNFIGTTDAQPLAFKVNNQSAGYIGTSSTANTAFGYQTLNVNTTGFANTANGYQALTSNTYGYYNIADGANALYNNTTGYSNVAIGSNALFKNTTASNNVAVGDSALYNQNDNYEFNTALGSKALYSNTTGFTNTATGYQALYGNTSGFQNTANGYQTLYSNTSGSNNTANGIYALSHNTTGSINTAFGTSALLSNVDGRGNTAMGYTALASNVSGNDNTANGTQALLNNTTGYSNVAIGSNALFKNISGSNLVAVGDSALYNQNGGNGLNTAVGSKALYSNTTGSYNTANGFQTLYSNTYGSENTAIGHLALYSNNSGSFNTALGFYALNNNTGDGNTAFGANALLFNTSGNNNTAIGYLTDVTGVFSNSSAFGYNTAITASNQVRIGNASISSIGGYKAWTNLSDGRVKKNIKENVPGLAFINLLKPITYNLDLDAADKIVQRHVIKDKNGKAVQPSQEEMNARRIQQKIVCTGFIAQDVEATAKKIGYDFDGVDAAKNDKDLYGLRYSEFVVPLVKAVQELSTQNDELKKQNDDLAQRLAKLEAMMNMHQSPTKLYSASLDQNVPNPFSKATTISYSLPQKYSSAKIIVIDESGKTIKIFNLSGTGKGTFNFSSPFRVGASYQYSLLVDGKLIDTKQMILTK